MVTHKDVIEFITGTEWHQGLEGINETEGPVKFTSIAQCTTLLADDFLPPVAQDPVPDPEPPHTCAPPTDDSLT